MLAPVSVRECLILLAHGSVYDFKGNERHEMAALYLLIDVAVKETKIGLNVMIFLVLGASVMWQIKMGLAWKLQVWFFFLSVAAVWFGSVRDTDVLDMNASVECVVLV